MNLPPQLLLHTSQARGLAGSIPASFGVGAGIGSLSLVAADVNRRIEPPIVNSAVSQPRPPEADSRAASSFHKVETDLDEYPVDEVPWRRWLSRDERSRANRLRVAVHRRRQIAARCWIRQVLSAFLGCDPGAVQLTIEAGGKPRLAPEANPADLRFSLSHCGTRALFVVTVGRDIGVDLQRPLPDAAWPAVAERFLTFEERETLRSLPPVVRAAAFAEIWTRKEALGKALGAGLAPTVLSLTVGPSSWGAIDRAGARV